MADGMTREQLIAFVNAAQNVPAPVRAMAGLFIMRMSEKQIAIIGAKVERIKTAIDAGQWDQVAEIAGGLGLPAGYVDYARQLITQNANAENHPTGQ